MRYTKTLTILALVLISACCTPVKRTINSHTTATTDYTQVASDLRKQEQRLDLAIEMLSATKEQIAEWLNEQIDYEEQRYDSLGRLISSIKQTTNRKGGKETAKTDNKAAYVGLSVEQVDSILSARLTSIKTDLTTKEKTAERVGLSWWQTAFMTIGIISAPLMLIWIMSNIVKLIRRIKP